MKIENVERKMLKLLNNAIKSDFETFLATDKYSNCYTQVLNDINDILPKNKGKLAPLTSYKFERELVKTLLNGITEHTKPSECARIEMLCAQAHESINEMSNDIMPRIVVTDPSFQTIIINLSISGLFIIISGINDLNLSESELNTLDCYCNEHS